MAIAVIMCISCGVVVVPSICDGRKEEKRKGVTEEGRERKDSDTRKKGRQRRAKNGD